MTSRLFAFVIWAAVAASIVALVSRVASSPRAVPAYVIAVGGATQAHADWSRLLGSTAPTTLSNAAPAPESSRLRLVGVVAPRGGVSVGEGLALIAVDDKPARPYRVGAAVEDQLVLLSVNHRGASLGPREGPARMTLELPLLPLAATGTRPTAISQPVVAPAVVPALPTVPQPVPDGVGPPRVPGEQPSNAPTRRPSEQG